MSTLQKPLPAWTGEAMIVPVPNFLQDAWDASDSFAVAFVTVYQQITEGYDAAVAEGRIRHDGDVVVDEEHELPNGGFATSTTVELQRALLRGEGWLGSVELARRYDCCRQTVHRLAKEMGVTLGRAKGAAREVAEAYFRDGVTSPSAILRAIAEQCPEAPLPKRNTITQWRIRYERLQKA